SLVRKILADNELKSSLQEKALKLGQSWSWPNIGKQYTTLFNQLLDTNITEESSYHYARL
ncbi:MAG: glycosyl transferase family 1, partial [Syntrophomonadaceae bacterium]|nr:glycosyl transferase family 1 [Syntrophomonadaceae bacterium]